MPRKFMLSSDSKINSNVKAGAIVYECNKYDYGCVSDDTAHTGVRHISLTLDPAGNYPFFTHPENDLVPQE